MGRAMTSSALVMEVRRKLRPKRREKFSGALKGLGTNGPCAGLAARGSRLTAHAAVQSSVFRGREAYASLLALELERLLAVNGGVEFDDEYM